MEGIRYTRRICEDQEKIDRFLKEKRVGVLTMIDLAGNPYGIPVNYVYRNKAVYIHGMGSGKKNNILGASPSVCFTVFEERGTVTDAVPCKCDTAYLSVVMFGSGELVTDPEEKTEVLNQFLEKFVPGLFQQPMSKQFIEKYQSGMDQKQVAVFRILPTHLTAKESPVDPSSMFAG